MSCRRPRPLSLHTPRFALKTLARRPWLEGRGSRVLGKSGILLEGFVVVVVVDPRGLYESETIEFIGRLSGRSNLDEVTTREPEDQERGPHKRRVKSEERRAKNQDPKPKPEYIQLPL
jgi:hypothetical protein